MCDGSNINIWRDKWLLRASGLKVTAKKNRTMIKWVSDLMMSGQRRWDENLIRHLFYPHDAEEILKLRILNLNEGDFIAWHHEKNGLFSVKSAYNLVLKLKDRKENVGKSNTAINGERRFWNIIWKANIPQNIRIFGWHATFDSLTVQVNRVLHHQATIRTCSICGVEDESTFHALVSCPKARALRLALRKVWNLPGKRLSIILDLTSYLFY